MIPAGLEVMKIYVPNRCSQVERHNIHVAIVNVLKIGRAWIRYVQLRLIAYTICIATGDNE